MTGASGCDGFSVVDLRSGPDVPDQAWVNAKTQLSVNVVIILFFICTPFQNAGIDVHVALGIAKGCQVAWEDVGWLGFVQNYGVSIGGLVARILKTIARCYGFGM